MAPDMVDERYKMRDKCKVSRRNWAEEFYGLRLRAGSGKCDLFPQRGLTARQAGI